MLLPYAGLPCSCDDMVQVGEAKILASQLHPKHGKTRLQLWVVMLAARV